MPARLQVTKKDKEQESNWTALKKALGVVWPHILYCAGFLAGQSALGLLRAQLFHCPVMPV